MFKHILVPTDFEAPADAALTTAIELAQRFGAKLSILHVYSLPPVPYGGPLAWPLDELAGLARSALDDLLAKAKPRFPTCEAILQRGNPWERILATAAENGADLIVMGTHGRKGVARALIGSITEKVVRMSPVPVLTVSNESAK